MPQIAKSGISLIARLVVCIVLSNSVLAENHDYREKFSERRDWLVTHGVIEQGLRPQFVNSLIESQSPYLLSHSLQPVNWVEWTEKIIKKGFGGRLVYLSIGYSTCYWCHVMAEESFSNVGVAQILNDSYLSVKIDREQLPALDYKYRSALEKIQGEAGWPINVILTPQGDIIWIDSYLHRKELEDVLIKLANKWEKSREKVKVYAELLSHQVTPPPTAIETKYPAEKEVTDRYTGTIQQIVHSLAQEKVTSGPRFLRATWMMDVLKYAISQDNGALADGILKRLDEIITSPVWDPVEGGFHRYSESHGWSDPHFEKMLYDQAHMITVLTVAYAVTENDRYLQVIKSTVNWVEQYMKLKGEGYASALSAFSDEGEGAYYLITDSMANMVDNSFISSRSIRDKRLVKGPLNDATRARLKGFREKRSLPYRDDKLIVSWNAMYLNSLIKAYLVTEDERYRKLAINLGENLWELAWSKGRLYRALFMGAPSAAAVEEDYAWLGLSYINGADALKKPKWNNYAIKLGRALVVETNMPPQLKDGEVPASGAITVKFMNELEKIPEGIIFRDKKRGKISAGFSEAGKDTLKHAAFISAVYGIGGAIPELKQSFANGQGTALAARSDANRVVVRFVLNNGWHINANPAGQDNLIATQVNPVLQEEGIIINYPEPVHTKFAFAGQSLPVYEGTVEIPIDLRDSMQVKMVQVKLQACSNRICLPPETLALVVRPSR